MSLGRLLMETYTSHVKIKTQSFLCV